MRHTLKAVFDRRSDAQHVLDALLESGYPRADMALSDMSERHVITLTTASDPEAARAAGIMAQYGPAGLDDIHDEGDPAAWTGAVAPRRDYPPGTAPGALQHHPHEDSHYFGTQNADAPPAGNTFKETLGSIAQWNNPDEGAEWAAPAGGNDLRSDAGHPDQTWEDVEPALKSDWERRHANSEASAWDKVKLAMRHGWERMHH